MRIRLSSLLAALTLAACSGGGDGGPTPPATPVLTSVAIASSAQTVVAGLTLQLTATPRDQNGNAISATVSWTSAATNVASVSGTGLVAGLVPGTTTITAQATAGGRTVSSTTQVTVTAPPVVPVLTSVIVSAVSNSILVGATTQLTAAPRDQNGNAITASVTWSSSAQGVATVNASGLAAGVAAGTATITATAVAGGVTVTGSAQITVSVPVLTSVVVTPTAPSVAVGATSQLTASPRDQNGNAIAATVTWATSAQGIATVSASGLVAGVAVGTATITATATAGGASANGNVQVTVTAAPLVLTSVTITAPATTVQAGNTIQLAATPKDQNGSTMQATVTWGTSAQGIATVSATGLVTGVAAGNATITATATAGGVNVQNSVQITVTAAPPVLTSVVISPASPPSIAVAATTTLTASPRDQNNNVIAATVTWSSLNAGIATVNLNTGVVTGVAGGTAAIRATATAGGVTVTADKNVTVTGGFPSNADVTANASSLFVPNSVDIAVGGSVDFTFEALEHNVTFSAMAGAPANIGNMSNATVSRTFNTAGGFNYTCTLHGGMNGTVIVH